MLVGSMNVNLATGLFHAATVGIAVATDDPVHPAAVASSRVMWRVTGRASICSRAT